MQSTPHGPWAGPAAWQDQWANRREQVADKREQVADQRERVADQRDAVADRRERDANRREAGLDNRARTLGLAVPERQARAREASARSRAKVARSREAIERSRAALRREEAGQKQRRARAQREYEALASQMTQLLCERAREQREAVMRSVSASGRMNGMVNAPDALGDDPCTITEVRAIDEPGEGLVEMEITVGCSRANLWQDRPGEHPWFREFSHRVRLGWNQGQMGVDPNGRIRFDVPRGELEDFIRTVRRAARDTDAEYQASMARYGEYARRQAQARREAQADPAKRARLAEDQARIDAVLAETGS